MIQKNLTLSNFLAYSLRTKLVYQLQTQKDEMNCDLKSLVQCMKGNTLLSCLELTRQVSRRSVNMAYIELQRNVDQKKFGKFL